MTELEELKKLLAEAEKQSPLPWYTNGTSLFDDATYKLCDYLDPPEAALIVAAVNALPGLIARVEENERLSKRVWELENALTRLEGWNTYDDGRPDDDYVTCLLRAGNLRRARAALRKEP